MLSPNDFEDLAAVERRLLAFEERYDATAAPFKWRHTTTNLHPHLERLDHHDRTLQAA
ncbi:hypothetical protein [Rhodococcus wratislaviensis]|uniref:hypothetical protein n=1 Tax=Rhodococcus wratislaviensis TaxID=44752 RepID=UPI00365D4CA1